MAEVNYEARDFEAIKESLIAYARIHFPEWTDLNESDQGKILVELYAYIGDSAHFYIDKSVDEWDIRKVTQRQNAAGLLALIGYTMAGATAAEVDETFTIEAPAAANIPIPKGFKIYTRDARNPIVYEVKEAGQIQTGTTNVTIRLVQGETKDKLWTFSGAADQEVTLESTPYLDGSATAEIDGEAWNLVENLLDSDAAALDFYVTRDDRERAVLRFGDGINGAKPTGSGTITYRVGGGVSGRVGPDTLTVPESPQLVDELGNPVWITVANPGSSEGGDDAESIDSARVRGPAESKANQRTVDATDFVNHATEVTGIVRALPRYTRIDATIPENVIRLQIIPDGGGLPTTDQKTAVQDYLYNDKPVPLTMTVDPIDPNYVPVDVTFQAIPLPGQDQTDLNTRTAAAIAAYLADYGTHQVDVNGEELDDYVLDWGMTLYPDDLAIKVSGCRSIKITAPAAPVVCAADQIPSAGTIAGV